ncbi:MAG: PEGA domain-containing protein [Myxococcales bacterium]|nr:PEGA domain-containing protein [Myxococcales bacterium]
MAQDVAPASANGPGLFTRLARFAFPRLGLVVALWAGLTSAPAHGQSARELLERGLQALKENRFKEAAADLDASYRLEQTPVALYNLGLAYSGLGYPAKAIEALEAYTQFADADKDTATIAAVKEEVERLRNGHARFVLSLQPPNARITIDGSVARADKGELWVKPGERQIAVSSPGYEDFEQTLKVQPGRFELDINLRRPSGPPEERAAKLLDEGDALLAEGDVLNAETRYSAAQRILHTARGAGSAGLAQEQLGRLAEAEANVLAALAQRRDKWVRKHRRRLRQAKRRLAGALATITVLGNHPGAELSIGERKVGTLPLPGKSEVRVQAGIRTLRATLDGYEDFLFEFELPARGRRTIQVEMSKAKPAPAAAAVPAVAGATVAAPEAGAAALPASEGPASAAPASDPAVEPSGPTQAELEAAVDPYDEGEPLPEYPAVQGFEMAVGIGYQAWLDDPTSNAGGAFATRLFSLGFRPFWPISFGVQLLNAYYDLGGDAEASFGVAPALYVRGHIQRDRRPLTFDAWAGIGIQPLSMSAAFFKSKDGRRTAVDLTSLDESDSAQVVQSELGIEDAKTLQSVNIPLEIGGAFYVTEGIAVELTLALTFWLPTQACIHGSEDRVCYNDDLDTLKTFYVGGGLSFLP